VGKNWFQSWLFTFNLCRYTVAEHQATQGDVYWKYFHFTVFTAPAGMIMVGLYTYKLNQVDP
jgi:hypothetical protein